jgi:hypothetical protein
MFGCFRKGEANDPDTYVAAITATLARFPEEVITAVTHPATGLPTIKSWLPSVKEVFDACNEAWEPIKQTEFRIRNREQQLAARAAFDRIRDEATGERIAPSAEENAA